MCKKQLTYFEIIISVIVLLHSSVMCAIQAKYIGSNGDYVNIKTLLGNMSCCTSSEFVSVFRSMWRCLMICPNKTSILSTILMSKTKYTDYFTQKIICKKGTYTNVRYNFHFIYVGCVWPGPCKWCSLDSWLVRYSTNEITIISPDVITV